MAPWDLFPSPRSTKGATCLPPPSGHAWAECPLVGPIRALCGTYLGPDPGGTFLAPWDSSSSCLKGALGPPLDPPGHEVRSPPSWGVGAIFHHPSRLDHLVGIRPLNTAGLALGTTFTLCGLLCRRRGLGPTSGDSKTRVAFGSSPSEHWPLSTLPPSRGNSRPERRHVGSLPTPDIREKSSRSWRRLFAPPLFSSPHGGGELVAERAACCSPPCPCHEGKELAVSWTAFRSSPFLVASFEGELAA